MLTVTTKLFNNRETKERTARGKENARVMRRSVYESGNLPVKRHRTSILSIPVYLGR